MQAFGPADEVLLFRQKDPKPCSPVHGPTENDQNVRQQGRRRLARAAYTLVREAENAADGRFDHSLPCPSASAPNKMAQKLAALKQPSPKQSIRGCGSAAPEGGGNT